MKLVVPLSIILLTFIVCFGCNHQKKKVLYVNSYHAGYPPSDEITSGISDQLAADSFDLKTVFLDSKRQTSDSAGRNMLDQTLSLIDEFNPDILIVSDDFAVKYLVLENFMNVDLPVVFCGVNWSASQYGLPVKNVTGMLEVLPLGESLDLIRTYYPDISKIAIVSENSLSEQSNSNLLDTLYISHGLIPGYFLVNDFADWKEAFKNAMDSADIVYLPTNGAIKNWNQDEAVQFVSANIRKPVFTCDEFMMDLCVIGLTKVAYEQGNWAGETAKKILSGVSVSSIPVTRNTQVTKWINQDLAERIGFIVSDSINKSFVPVR